MVELMEEESLQDNRFSFSKLTSFNTCKFGFEKRYIEHQRGIGNCFSSYGKLIHSILERYAKNEISLEGLLDTYKWEFNNAVKEPFPNTKYCPDMRKLYYEQGIKFLTEFPGYKDIKVLEVESDFDIEIDDWIFTGVIDFVYLDLKTNELILRDWKSKSSFASKKERDEYARQLFLYCLFVQKKYGKFPDKLQFFLFRKNKIEDIPFDTNKLNEAIGWARETVKNIRTCWTFPPSTNDFFCNHLCNYRLECPYNNSKE